MRSLAQIAVRRKRQDRMFQVVGIACTMVGLVTLSALLGKLIYDGASQIDWKFLTSFPSYKPEKAGILSPLVGSMLVILVTAAMAVPLGIAAAVYLEEYGKKNRLGQVIEINISNLAGVPSIIYGLLVVGLYIGLTELVTRWYLSPDEIDRATSMPVDASVLVQLDKAKEELANIKASIFIGGFTLAMLVLPIVIVATREALRSIPSQIREAAYALGATKWQVIRHHLLPYSLGGISTGVIIALSRALGETAPLIVVGAAGTILFLPEPPVTTTPPYVSLAWTQSPYTVMPMQMFNWTNEPKAQFHQLAAATGLVLIAITLSMNSLAMIVRYRARRRIKW